MKANVAALRCSKACPAQPPTTKGLGEMIAEALIDRN
jgi:hypothetical protein